MMGKIDVLKLEIIWTRLISIVDEAGMALKRTAFSEVIRDSADYGLALFDTGYNLLAQANNGTPGFIGAFAYTMQKFGEAYPPEKLQPGDVLITNNPWYVCGHTNDIALASPIYFKNRLVAYAICVAHHNDIGGRMLTSETMDVFEEGLQIPIVKLYEAGRPNDTAFEFIRSNVRQPVPVVGDLRAQLAGNDMVSQRLGYLMEEYNLEDIEELSHEILSRSEKVVRESIRRYPEGTCKTVMPIGREVNIAVAITLKDGEIFVDFAGTSPQIAKSMNVCFNFTQSETMLALKCAVSPFTPNNSGVIRPFKVTAPEGSILNARFPAPVCLRTAVALQVPEIVFNALSALMPDRVIAGSPGGYLAMVGLRQNGRLFITHGDIKGGLGARPTSDGVPTLSFPANSFNAMVEMAEATGPIFFEMREFETDSAGAGKYRGGLGARQVIHVEKGEFGPMGPTKVFMQGGRATFSVPGLLGGHSGPKGFWKISGQGEIDPNKGATLMPGDHLELFMPGGGGYGDPLERDLSMVEEDVRNEFVSLEAAKEIYGAVMDPSGWNVDAKASEAMRALKRSPR
jgi:N-methylhydantoinase B